MLGTLRNIRLRDTVSGCNHQFVNGFVRIYLELLVSVHLHIRTRDFRNNDNV